MSASASQPSAAPPSAAPIVLSPQQARLAACEPEFRASLEEDSGMITIAGETFHPADVLGSLAPMAYQAALGEFVQERMDSALRRACDEFPAPVAIPLYRALNSAENDHERLLRYKDTAEGLILVLFAVVLAECRAKGVKLKSLTFPRPNGAPEVFTPEKLINDRVSYRLAMLDGLLSGLAGNASLVSIKRISIAAVRRLNDLNDIRHDFVHYGAKTAMEAAQICQEVREQLADAMLAFDWLADTELVIYAGRVTGQPNVAKLEVCNGNGQNRAFTERTLTAKALSDCQSILLPKLDRPLFHWNGEICEAAPFLFTQLTSKGHRRDVWVFKRRTSAQFELENVGEGDKNTAPGSPAPLWVDEQKVLQELFT